MTKFSLNQLSKNSGFTLLEMLIVTSIIIVLSVIVVANYEFGGYKHSLQRSAHKLAQDIRKAEEMAMSAREFEGVVPIGYGVYLDYTSYPDTYYVFFADKNGNGQYETSTIPLYDETVEGPVYLEENVDIFHTCFSGGASCHATTSIAFFPPIPLVRFNNKDPLDPSAVPPIGSLEITLYSSKAADQITILVNPVGLVEIQ